MLPQKYKNKIKRLETKLKNMNLERSIERANIQVKAMNKAQGEIDVANDIASRHLEVVTELVRDRKALKAQLFEKEITIKHLQGIISRLTGQVSE